MTRFRRISRSRNLTIAGLLLVTLCLMQACADQVPTVDSDSGPQASEPIEPPSQSSGPAEQPSTDVQADVCVRDGGCQATGIHCCSANRLFAPFDCGDLSNNPNPFSGYVCGTCIPANFCQPTGDHCCSARHAFVGSGCGGTVKGKQYSGYKCL